MNESATSCESDELMDIDNLRNEENEACYSKETFQEGNNEMKDLQNDFNLKDPFSPLYQSADITYLEGFLSILAFCVRFHLNGTCIEELLRLLKILLPPCTIPGSKYLLNKKVKLSMKFDKFYKIHLFCGNCKEYISELLEDKDEILCNLCKEKKSSSQLLHEGHFFIYVPLEHQIRQKLEKQDLFAVAQKYVKIVENGSYKDVISGDSYPKSEMTSSLSLQFNVDGTPMYHKAKYDLWPIHCMVNELSVTKIYLDKS